MTAAPAGAVSAPDIDPDDWVERLQPHSPDRQRALRALHALLLRAARAEQGRRAGASPVGGPELDDLAHQAADDALLAILRRLPEFRGESRFTTWAYKFAIVEVSSKLGRHYWAAHGTVALDVEQWERLPARLSLTPESAAEVAELSAAVRDAVESALTERQRKVFMALVVDGVPLDALSALLGTDRNTIYKVMFDARRKLRAALVAAGYLEGALDGAPESYGPRN